MINVTVVETEIFQIFSATNSVTLDSLRPFTTYICAVAAQTAIGVGPFSIIIVVNTLEAGRQCFSIYSYPLNTVSTSDTTLYIYIY